jgi:hypothetical protein
MFRLEKNLPPFSHLGFLWLIATPSSSQGSAKPFAVFLSTEVSELPLPCPSQHSENSVSNLLVPWLWPGPCLLADVIEGEQHLWQARLLTHPHSGSGRQCGRCPPKPQGDAGVAAAFAGASSGPHLKGQLVSEAWKEFAPGLPGFSKDDWAPQRPEITTAPAEVGKAWQLHAHFKGSC